MEGRNGAKWIWSSNFHDADTEVDGKFVLFRKTFDLAKAPTAPCLIHVSADTRYRLFVNGVSVAFGPCKSFPERWYYETIDVSSHLRTGTNIIAARVLRFFPGQVGSSSMMKANIPGFLLWSNKTIEGMNTPLITDESWMCCEDQSVRIKSRAEWNYILGPPFLSLDERVDLTKAESGWENLTASSNTAWKQAVPAVKTAKMLPVMEPWKLHERPIPLLPEVPKSFAGALKNSDGGARLKEWTDLLQHEKQIVVDAGQSLWVEMETTALTTGFFELEYSGGNGTEVTILYAESYEKDLGTDKSTFPLPRTKTDRRDFHNGRLYGTEDSVILFSKNSTEPFRYEPFWFRTFRFIRLSITTKDTPLKIHRIRHRETKYPLKITTEIRQNLPSQLSRIWDMCVRTLEFCMHETYEDCPFYEQNQFAMDGRLQLLFTYQLCRDDRLARKTIHEFHASRRRDDGLLETNFPASARLVNIPQFSLYWIMMLHDHMMYFGDKPLVRRYMPTADGILAYFQERINPTYNMVGEFDAESWPFVDWVKEWQGDIRQPGGIRNMAIPPVYKRNGIVAYNSLVYAWVLKHAAELCEFIGRRDMAANYRAQADGLNKAVLESCYDTQLNLFVDGPGAKEVCEHTQIFAILSGAISGQAARSLLQKSMKRQDMPSCSFAMRFYVFRALSITGLYADYFGKMMQAWDKMVEQNLTTCAEDDVSFRSDCHGWSASPIYEIVNEMYGIKTEEPGMTKWAVWPRRQLLETADVRYHLPKGKVLSVQWKKGGNVSTSEVTEESSHSAGGR